MKRFGFLAMLALSGAATAAPAPAPTAEAIVDAQVAAFNHGDLKAFGDLYADEIEIVTLGAPKPLVAGKKALLDYYGPIFAKYHPQATVLHRASSGDYVSDQERVGVGTHMQEGLTIYQVVDGRIRRVWLTP